MNVNNKRKVTTTTTNDENINLMETLTHLLTCNDFVFVFVSFLFLFFIIYLDVITKALTFDWITKVLYWTEDTTKRIVKMHVNSSNRQIVVTNAGVSSYPLMVLPCQRYGVSGLRKLRRLLNDFSG